MARSNARLETTEVEYEKQTWNVYSMLLLVALLAITIGCIFLAMELKAYNWDYTAKSAAAIEVERDAAGATKWTEAT